MATDDISGAEIIQALEIFDGDYPRELINAAIEQRQEITPYLISILEKVLADPETYANDYDYIGHTYAIMLLAYFREPRAHQIIVDLVSLPGETPFELFGDLITEDLPAILIQTCGGELAAIKGLVTNMQANPYCRSSAARALVFAVAEGLIPRIEIIRFFGPVFADEMAFPESEFITMLSHAIFDLNPAELIDVVRLAYRQDLIDPLYIGTIEDYEKDLEKPIEECLMEKRAELEKHSSPDFHARISWWAMFTEKPAPKLTDYTPNVKKKGKKRKKRR